MKEQDFNSLDENEIRLLPWRDAIRQRPGMYVSTVQDANILFRELVDNNADAVTNCDTASTIIVEQDFNGYFFSGDDGYGIPIKLSVDREGATQCEVAVTALHSGSKFNASSKFSSGQNGCGASAVNALSESFIILSRITEENYDKSINSVLEAWNSCGPRQRKDLYYIIAFERGGKVYEGAHRIQEIEKMLFGTLPQYKEFPRGLSTITIFKPDPEIFESCTAKVPKKNLEYFTLIQEKFYKRKINVIINGQPLRDSIKPYQFEFIKEIIPADQSKNPSVKVWISFEIGDDLTTKNLEGSVNSLVVESGAHLNFIQSAYEAALKSEYKISHKYLTEGLNLLCIVLAPDVVFDSQVKSRLRQISKVKVSDFEPIAKEFIKIFRKNSDIFQAHVDRLDQYALSQKAFGAKEKSLRMISSGRGVGFYKSRAEVPRGFADATNPNRLETELYLCFPADQEILLVGDEGEYNLSFEQLSEQFKLPAEEQGDFYTYATTSTGKSRRTKIIACKEIKKTWEIVKVTLSDGTSFRCTPDHKVRLEGGEYKEAGSLLANDKVMMREGEGKSGVTPSIILWENHKEPIPVYCLEVQDKEHNFSLDNGVVVKNCEGASSASGLVNGRKDTKTAAILPLRGKVLNVSDKDESAALDNKEINAIFKLVGLGTSSGNVFEGCKTQEDVQKALQKHAGYGKIIIATDADSDGLAIRNALVYAFAKLGKFLIDLNMLYYANSPIFEQDGKFYYPDDPFTSDGFPVGLDPSRHFRRFKGLTEKV